MCFLLWKILLGLELSALCDSSYESFFLYWSYLLFVIPHIKVSSWTGVICSLWFLFWKPVLGLQFSTLCSSSFERFFLGFQILTLNVYSFESFFLDFQFLTLYDYSFESFFLCFQFLALYDYWFESFILGFQFWSFMITPLKASFWAFSSRLFMITHDHLKAFWGAFNSRPFMITHLKASLGFQFLPLYDYSFESFLFDWSSLLFVTSPLKASSFIQFTLVLL